MQPSLGAEDLALLIASSRVGVAALQRKYAENATWNGDTSQAARVLRDHYRMQFELANAPREITAEDVPDDGIRGVLRSIYRNGIPAVKPALPPPSMSEFLILLERVIDSTLTPEEADKLIDHLNTLSPRREANQR